MWGLMFHIYELILRVLLRKDFSYRLQSYLKWSGEYFFLVLCVLNTHTWILQKVFCLWWLCLCGSWGWGWSSSAQRPVRGVVISFSKYSVFVMKRRVDWRAWKSWSNSFCLEVGTTGRNDVKMIVPKRWRWMMTEGFYVLLCFVPNAPNTKTMRPMF